MKWFAKKVKNKGHKICLNNLKTDDSELNEKLDKYCSDVNNGFRFYNKIVLNKFILGYGKTLGTEKFKLKCDRIKVNKSYFSSYECFNTNILLKQGNI